MKGTPREVLVGKALAEGTQGKELKKGYSQGGTCREGTGRGYPRRGTLGRVLPESTCRESTRRRCLKRGTRKEVIEPQRGTHRRAPTAGTRTHM